MRRAFVTAIAVLTVTTGCGSDLAHKTDGPLQPQCDEWTYLTHMTLPRAQHDAIALDDGTIFVSGGFVHLAADDTHGIRRAFVTSTEIVDPASGKSKVGPELPAARADYASVELDDGRIVLAGGVNENDQASQTIAIVDLDGSESTELTAEDLPDTYLPATGDTVMAPLGDGEVVLVKRRGGAPQIWDLDVDAPEVTALMVPMPEMGFLSNYVAGPADDHTMLVVAEAQIYGGGSQQEEIALLVGSEDGEATVQQIASSDMSDIAAGTYVSPAALARLSDTEALVFHDDGSFRTVDLTDGGGGFGDAFEPDIELGDDLSRVRVVGVDEAYALILSGEKAWLLGVDTQEAVPVPGKGRHLGFGAADLVADGRWTRLGGIEGYDWAAADSSDRVEMLSLSDCGNFE